MESTPMTMNPSLLDLLHSCPLTELILKTDILRCLVCCLKESHR